MQIFDYVDTGLKSEYCGKLLADNKRAGRPERQRSVECKFLEGVAELIKGPQKIYLGILSLRFEVCFPKQNRYIHDKWVLSELHYN